MKKLEARARREAPWKNGGGTTTEVTRAPEGDSLEAFDWRISLARVASDGPFSSFPGIDRSLSILEGEGIALQIAGRGLQRIDRTMPPFAFPGDVPVSATLLGGEVLDLNVMTRRGVYRSRVARVLACPEEPLRPLGEATLIFVARGRVEARSSAPSLELDARDALLLARGEEALLRATVDVELLTIDLLRA